MDDRTHEWQGQRICKVIPVLRMYALAKYVWHSFSQHICFHYLRHYCLRLCVVLYEQDAIQRVFILSERYFFRYIEGAVKTQLQSPFDPCLTECTLTNLIFNNFSSSLHNPGNFNPSVHCTDLQFFWSHTRRSNVDSWTHLWALQISYPTDLGSSVNLKFSVTEAFISATHDGQCKVVINLGKPRQNYFQQISCVSANTYF